jgi:hypothetical protein
VTVQSSRCWARTTSAQKRQRSSSAIKPRTCVPRPQKPQHNLNADWNSLRTGHMSQAVLPGCFQHEMLDYRLKRLIATASRSNQVSSTWSIMAMKLTRFVTWTSLEGEIFCKRGNKKHTKIGEGKGPFPQRSKYCRSNCPYGNARTT